MNEVECYIAELESDFSKQDRAFEYTQMEPQNRFVAEVLRRKLFMEKYQRYHAL